MNLEAALKVIERLEAENPMSGDYTLFFLNDLKEVLTALCSEPQGECGCYEDGDPGNPDNDTKTAEIDPDLGHSRWQQNITICGRCTQIVPCLKPSFKGWCWGTLITGRALRTRHMPRTLRCQLERP